MIRKAKYLWQRLTRGWDDSDIWCLDWTFVRWVTPRLKRLKEIQHGYPIGLTEAEWEEILDEMIWGFQRAVYQDFDLSPPDIAALDRSMELFAKHFRSLWD